MSNVGFKLGGARGKLEACLASMPQAGYGKGFNDRALPQVARLAKLAGLTEADAIQVISATQKAAKRDPEQEIRSTVERIYSNDGERQAKKGRQLPEVDKKLVQEVTAGPFSVQQLIVLSPVHGLDALSSTYFLELLFDGDPLVTVGRKEKLINDKLVIPGHTLLVSRIETFSNRKYEYVVPSPAIKRIGRRKDGKQSRHSEDMYPVRNYLVLESDNTPKDQWAAILHHLSQFAPLVMAVDTRGKSLHGWFDCTGTSEADVLRFFSYAAKLGADPKMLDIYQFARLPHGIRSENGEMQWVLYWDPEARKRKWNLDELPDDAVRVCSIFDIPADEDPEDSNLLGDRFLCRGKAAELVGPTGVGKSTLAVQAALRWAAGLDMFGIRPQRPLRGLYVQAENDDQDVLTIVGGILEGLAVSQEQRELMHKNLLYCRLNDYGQDILAKIDGVVSRAKIDLLILDPLFAYMPGSAADQATVSEFLRRRLQPFLERHGCGCLVLHHVNKPPGAKKDRADWKGGEFAYAGSGSSELANFFKAVLVVRDIGSRDVFQLIVAKRHKKAGLTNLQGEVTDRVHIKHSPDPVLQYWELGSEEDAANEESVRHSALGDAFVELVGGNSGTVTTKALAEAMGKDKRTIDRMFERKESVHASARGGTLHLVLSRMRGKVTGYEKLATGGLGMQIRKGMDDMSSAGKDTAKGMPMQGA